MKILKNKKNKISKKKKILIVLISIFCVGLGSGLFLLYGPYRGFREWLITTAMSTMNHQYLATWFYSNDTINKVLESNKTIEPDGDTDTNLVNVNKNKINVYGNEYEKEVLEHDEGDIYKIIDIKGDNYEGYLAVVYDPSKIKLVTSKYLGTDGQYLVDMAKENKAVLAINGGGFLDINNQGKTGYGNGGLVRGIVIKDGKIINKTSSGNGVIGFTTEDKLYLGKISAEEAINLGVRDAVEFGPFLIVNGQSSFISGNGGYGVHPRTAIGQRKDGIVLMLVIDGRRIDCLGADMNDLAEIMLKYGAYNAANLDGGNSSVMVVKNKIINRPINWENEEKTRPIATGFIVVE